MTVKRYNGALTSTVNNGSALLAMTTDEVRGEVARYTYDNKGRLTVKTVTDEADFSQKISEEIFAYDAIDRLTSVVCTYDPAASMGVTGNIYYATDASAPDADNRVSKYTCTATGAGMTTTVNTYDEYKRLKKKTYTVGSRAFTKTVNYNKTRVSSEVDSAGGTTSYTYDDCGRIRTVTAGGKAIRYTYDEYGQLVREDNQVLDKSYRYVYNEIGNLTSVQTFAYTTGALVTPQSTATFGYTADRLTSFGGATIAYNAIGCPTTYDGKTATWTKGRLSKLSKGAISTGMQTYAYTYNGFGQRVARNYTYMRKLSNGQAVESGVLTQATKKFYYDHAGRLIAESGSKTYSGEGTTTDKIVYLYDESSIIGMAYTLNGVTNKYYFQRNLQGDVIGIYNTSGALVAKYNYDAWGNCTIGAGTTNHAVANANPIRYRGYYYDDDTGLYYCNARYYSPKWRRFISPDDTAYLDPKSVNGLNLYCYCGNDPINYIDSNGKFPIVIEAINTLISGTLDLYEYLLKKSLKFLLNQPTLTMDVAKRLAREGGYIQSARAIMRSHQSTIALTRDSLETVSKVGKTLGKVLLVADIAWSLGENLLSGEESWVSDTIVDAGVALAIYGLSLVPYVGFFLSLGATVATFIFEDEIDQFKDWVYEGWSEFWSSS